MPSYNFNRVAVSSVRYTLTSYVPEIQKRAGSELSRVVDEVSTEMWQDMQRDIGTGSRSGRIYIRRGKSHQASAPGEPPARDNGILLAALIKRMVNPLLAELDSQNNAYAAALELGRADGSIAPRPFFVKAIQRRANEFFTKTGNVLVRL